MEFKVKFELTKLPPVRIKYPDYEKIDYEVFGGMTVMEFARNLLPLLMQGSPDLIAYEDPRKQLEPFLVVTNVFPSSQINRTRVIRSGTRIAEINGKKVKTLEDFRAALQLSIDTGFLTIKTMVDMFGVCDIEKIIKEEFDLASTYKYNPSLFIQKFIETYVEKHEKKTGPSAAGTTAAPQ